MAEVMKVIHFSIGRHFGGVEKLQIHLSEYRSMSEDIEPVFVLCYDGNLASELRQRGATVEIVPPPTLERPWSRLSTFRSLARIVKRHRVELIVSHEMWNHAVAWPVEKLLSIKSVLWIHSSTFDKHYSQLYRRLNRLRPDLAICCSQFVQGLFDAKWPEIKSDYLYHPYGRPERKHKSKHDRVRFIYVGRMVEYKGLAEIVEACGRVKASNYELVVVGDAQTAKEADYKEQVISRCRELGIQQNVSFVGFVEDVFDYLSSADAFVHPNNTPEAFGMVFIEALLAGCPVIATDIGGAKEILAAQPSKMGDLVPPNDIHALSKVLETYIEDVDYRSRISDHVEKEFINICDPKKSMAKLSHLLTDLVLKPA